MAHQTIQIGDLARRTGCNIETIRYYERIGLVPAPPRRRRYRSYGRDDVARLGFVRRARELGFTLDEVGSLLELDEACACAETRELAAHKLQVIEEKLADLKAMRKALTALLRQCDTGATAGNCPIIHTLAAD